MSLGFISQFPDAAEEKEDTEGFFEEINIQSGSDVIADQCTEESGSDGWDGKTPVGL